MTTAADPPSVARTGRLTEPEFAALIDAGCTCGCAELQVEAYVVQKINLHEGEPLGSPTWGHKGEDLVRGTYAIDCVRCQNSLYANGDCPECGQVAGVARALEATTETPMPERCPECDSDKLTVQAFVPARVVHGHGRAPKARSNVTPEDEAFHVLRVTCKGCAHVVRHVGTCVLCGAARARV